MPFDLLILSPDNRFLIAVASKQLTWIDMESNMVRSETKLPETLRAVYSDPEKSRILALGEKSLTILDASSGTTVGKLDGLADPRALILSTN